MNTLHVNAGKAPATRQPARRGWLPDWQRWAPYAAVGWSLLYAALAAGWAVTGRGFPYAAQEAGVNFNAIVARGGPGVAWGIVCLAGLPAAALGVAMLRGVHRGALRPIFIGAGVLLAGGLLVLMTDLNLLVLVGYLPYAVLGHFTPEQRQGYLAAWTQWTTLHQLICLAGGFVWLAATLSYQRRSAGACLYCGRGAGPEGWTSPTQAARWGRLAVYVALVAPIFYAFTRFAWALGFPLGMSADYWRRGQASGMWTSGLFLALFGLAGAVLMLGLIQRWGEVFPRWLPGLAGRRVPVALAGVPAALVAVLLGVGGLAIWSALPQMAATLAADGAQGIELVAGVLFQVGPTLLFPVWGAALAAATLGYYYRRRGPCRVCGRGVVGAASVEPGRRPVPPS